MTKNNHVNIKYGVPTYMCLTRYSTPVPELDDHRFQLDPPRLEAPPDVPLSPQNTAPQSFNPETPQRPDLLNIQDALREAGSLSRDFEHVIVDDDRSGNDFNAMGRRFSVDPTVNIRHGCTYSRTHQDIANLSCESSVSARSTSPPNSVEAFADPRRRERANTLESHGAPDLEAILQRTVSGGTHPRRPTFSNASVIRPQPGDVQLDPTDDTCLPTFEQPGRIPVIDYEELEEFVALSQKPKPAANRRKHSLSSQSKKPRVFYDLRPGAQKPEDEVKRSSSTERSLDGVLDSTSTRNEKIDVDAVNEKGLLEALKNENEPTRFGFFSSESQSTVHAAELGDLVLPGDTFRDLFQLGPEGGVWWLDVLNPTEDEVGALSRAFSIHPLTTEDILTQEAREKVELFKQYYFVCFRTFYQVDKTSEQFMEPVNFYMVVFRDGVLSFSFTENPHAANVRRRIGKLRDYVSLSSDWICYAMIDDIVDSFGPVIREIEVESEAIEDLVFIARMDDFESFLPRIGGLRKKVMSLMRLLGGKADVIRGFSKRCNEQYSVTPRGDIGLYLGDIQDHVVTMMSNLAHFEKMLSRSHTNYLAQLNVTNLMLGNHVNKVLSKVTLIATMLVPMNLICGLFGMNVHVPGEDAEGLGWFFGILGVIAAIIVLSGVAARCYKLV
ncbi:cora-domain-containing protein [Aspergillus ellipticus CBS 707.79]|uniref:Cora-domain-containing protein n=1 Tax=Aspergillus ellipticus CBS 707.79 TaxID=1448320 RepID=A0A319DLK2_9EURO|nr:cora-domain-containing protein [Aspergillus ellipticus CBS 707.79]